MSVKPPRTNDKIRLVKDRIILIYNHVVVLMLEALKKLVKIKIGKIENKGKKNRRVNLYRLMTKYLT